MHAKSKKRKEGVHNEKKTISSDSLINNIDY